jgi:sulfonate transport system ATP-binding protein
VLVLDAGRVAVDRPITLDRPRHAADPHFVAHRESLLSALGVDR